MFHSYIPSAGNRKIKIADGSLSAIAGKGSIFISKILTLHNVLYVPNLSCNLVSISKLTRDLKCCAKFSLNSCVFQDLDLGKTIDSAKECGGLHYFEEGSHSFGQAQQSSIMPNTSFGSDDMMIWHSRLGHPPNFHYSKHLFPKLFSNKNPSVFQCDIFQFVKHHPASFPIHPHQTSKPFAPIHSDV